MPQQRIRAILYIGPSYQGEEEGLSECQDWSKSQVRVWVGHHSHCVRVMRGRERTLVRAMFYPDGQEEEEGGDRHHHHLLRGEEEVEEGTVGEGSHSRTSDKR